MQTQDTYIKFKTHTQIYLFFTLSKSKENGSIRDREKHCTEHSAIKALRSEVLCNLGFPTVPILKQLLFVIQKLLPQWRNMRISSIH